MWELFCIIFLLYFQNLPMAIIKFRWGVVGCNQNFGELGINLTFVFNEKIHKEYTCITILEPYSYNEK